MKKVAKNNLFFTTSSSLTEFGGEIHHPFKQEGLYYRLINLAFRKGFSLSQLRNVGDRLIAMADHALDMRLTEDAERISEMLMNAPLPREYRQVGRYYQAVCTMRRGDYITPRLALEQIADSPITPLKYKARSLNSLGGNYLYVGDLNISLQFLLESAHVSSPRHACDLFTNTMSQLSLAIIKSIDGDHKGALADLESLFPFVRMLAVERPFYLYSYRNSLALELAEAGRIEEAQHNCRIILSSPLAHLNPEWSETAEEVAQKARRASHSFVSFSSAQPAQSAAHFLSGNLDQIIASETGPQPNARSLPMISNNPPIQIASRRSMRDLPPEEQLSHLARFVRDLGLCDPSLYPVEEGDPSCKGQSNKSDKSDLIDIESQSDLEGIINLWANHEITPELFAAVLLTLADCKDYLRFEEVSLRMIRYTFFESDDCTKSEYEWGRKVAAEIDLDSLDLEKIIRLWFMGNITPDQLGSILVQLGDCPDADERRQIIDRLVHCAFLEATVSKSMSEEAWRKKMKALVKPITGATA